MEIKYDDDDDDHKTNNWSHVSNSMQLQHYSYTGMQNAQ